MIRQHIILFIGLSAILFGHCVLAKSVEAEGRADITDDGVSPARQAAINDAIRQAAIQAGAHVQSSSQISENVLIADSARIRAIGKVSDITILDEWVDNEEDLYFVHIRANVVDSSDALLQPKVHSYRRKIAVTQFDVADRRQIHDVPNIEIAMAQEFMRRISMRHSLITKDATQYALKHSAQPYEALGLSPREIIVRFAEKMGVQFIVSGTIMDMGVTKHPLFIQLRHVELEIRVWDGISGALVAQHRLNGSVWEDRWIIDFPTTVPSMNDKYFASPIGHETDRIMNELISQVATDINNLPFIARVIKRDGKMVHLNVGGLSHIRTGDRLQSFKLAEEPEMEAFGGQFMGYRELPASTIVIKKVQPNFSIGELNAETPLLNPGDIVRVAW